MYNKPKFSWYSAVFHSTFQKIAKMEVDDDGYVRCKICQYNFPAQGMLTHIRQTNCQKELTPEELLQLKNLCNQHKLEKRKKSKAAYYLKRKKLKIYKVFTILHKYLQFFIRNSIEIM